METLRFALAWWLTAFGNWVLDLAATVSVDGYECWRPSREQSDG